MHLIFNYSNILYGFIKIFDNLKENIGIKKILGSKKRLELSNITN